MRTYKRLLYLLILTFVIGVFSACGMSDTNDTTVADSDDWHDAQVIVHGVRLKDVGNMTILDLEKMGFKKDLLLYLINNPFELKPNEQTYVSMKAKDGSKELHDFKVINKTGKNASVDKCSIKGIVVIEQNTDDDLLINATDIFLANGVGLGMTADEVLNIMGNPDEEIDEEGKLGKEWKYYINTEESQIFMIFDRETDCLSTLAITF